MNQGIGNYLQGCILFSNGSGCNRKHYSYTLKIWVFAICNVFMYPNPVYPQIHFEDATAEAGISYRGPGWGAAWGDMNSDGWPDLFTTNHARAPSLYINRAGVSFDEIAADVVSNPAGDTHGAAWADFDNNGDIDLIELAGAGSGPNHMFVNVSGTLTDKADELNISYPMGRGRSPVWYDYDNDGLLDVLLLNEKSEVAPVALFRNSGTSFLNITDVVGIDLLSANYGRFISLQGDSSPVLLLGEDNEFPSRVYDMSTIPYTDIKDGIGIPGLSLVTDIAVADFNGDLLSDVFLSRGVNQTSDIHQPSENKIEAIIAGGGKGLSFRSDGAVTFDFFAGPISSVNDIFIGSGGVHPAARRFTLSKDDAEVHGLVPDTPQGSPGVYVGYNLDTDEWMLQIYTGSAKLSVSVESDGLVTEVNPIGFSPFLSTLQNLYYENAGGVFSENVSYLDVPADVSNCHSVAAADFDNDTDMDLYLVCSGVLRNLENILYENIGNGSFTKVADAGGAAGSLEGQGAVVAIADYNMDGFLDIFVVNGRGAMHAEFHDADDQLFRNLGNENHWLQIDLVGTSSNRDGYGSVVEISAGGVTQRRLQDGGLHGYSQNLSRLHFGLGVVDSVVDRLTVEWPSGLMQIFENVSVDQVIRITEGDDELDVVIDMSPAPPDAPPVVEQPSVTDEGIENNTQLSTGAGCSVYVSPHNRSNDYTWLLMFGILLITKLLKRGCIHKYVR